MLVVGVECKSSRHQVSGVSNLASKESRAVLLSLSTLSLGVWTELNETVQILSAEEKWIYVKGYS